MSRRFRTVQRDKTSAKCARCDQPATMTKEILGQGIDRGERVFTKEKMSFCCAEHASHEQWSREG